MGMNMLIGLMCEVVGGVAHSEKEEANDFLAQNIRAVLTQVDVDEDLTISRDEFKLIVTHPDAVKRLHQIGVDPAYLVDYASTIFQSDELGQSFDKKLGFGEFMQLLLKCRGGTLVTMRDFFELRQSFAEENTSRNV